MSISAYVVMSTYDSPIAFVVPTPVAVFDRKKDADAYAKDKSARAARNTYYVRKAIRPEPSHD